ncbi:hypothetical protein [Streptomyces sp. NRRL WC-3549]|uniref:hypothetical protein n=1 Tax=Streptomyces sp. NRRL WC-3549 TaxID=1463925 RepID=UPI00131DCC11|nr:hypothetical protein [Streptomyces sp. NRRL WC-3549]
MHGIYILTDFARTCNSRDQCVASTRGYLEANQNRALLGISAAVSLIPQTFEVLTVLRNKILADVAVSAAVKPH